MCDFARQNIDQWVAKQKEIFPTAIPRRAVWDSLADIVSVLKNVSGGGLIHLFAHGENRHELRGAEISSHDQSIEIILDDPRPHILKPNYLEFHSFADRLDMSYFRLQLIRSESPVYEKEFACEQVVELPSGAFVSDDGSENQRLPDDARPVKRNLYGAMVMFANMSDYAQKVSSSDSPYNALNSEHFRDFVNAIIQKLHA